jgi:uncharacterized SAM-binding protein YcdF (DUF218 family)
MNAILSVVKLVLRPASVNFFIVVLAVGVILSISRRRGRVTRWYFGTVLLGYWVLSTPACAERLITWGGNGYRPLTRAADARGADVIVVLGSGSATYQVGGHHLNVISLQGALRVLEGARLYWLLQQPTVIVSGGVTSTMVGSRPESEAMRDAIVQLGVPPDHVVLESESKTTRDEAIVLRQLLTERGDRPADRPIVLVTSALHMGRALGVFRSVGLNPVPSAAPYKSDHAFESYRWLPAQGGMLLFDEFIYDTAAALYYSTRGWTRN